MLGQMPNDGNDNAVAGEMVRLVVIRRKLIVVRQTHEARGFAAGNQTRTNPLTFDDKDQLSA